MVYHAVLRNFIMRHSIFMHKKRLPLGGKLLAKRGDEGRTLFSQNRYYSNEKVFPLPAENCQPLQGFPSGEAVNIVDW